MKAMSCTSTTCSASSTRPRVQLRLVPLRLAPLRVERLGYLLRQLVLAQSRSRPKPKTAVSEGLRALATQVPQPLFHRLKLRRALPRRVASRMNVESTSLLLPERVAAVSSPSLTCSLPQPELRVLRLSLVHQHQRRAHQHAEAGMVPGPASVRRA